MLLAGGIKSIFKFIALHYTTGGNEEVIKAHDGHRGSGTRAVLITSSAALYAPFAPRAIGDMCPVVLLHVGSAGQSRVSGLIERLDVVFAFNFYYTLCYNVLERNQEASPTAVDSARCTEVARSYGSLAVSR